jgi:hypothetical protein
MARIDQAWLASQQSRFMPPDAHRYVKGNWPDDSSGRANGSHLHEPVASLICDIKSLLGELILLRRALLASKAGFKPEQPRVPKGNPGGGQWSGDGAPTPSSLPVSPAPVAPKERPSRRAERVGKVREIARWLSRIPAVGLAIQAYAGLENNARWLQDYHDVIQTYRDPPRTLDELRNAVSDPKPGYDIHHIVEQTWAERFGFSRSEIDGPHNLVRIPRMKHWEITGWYGRRSGRFGGKSPREYRQDKDWSERQRIGLEALIEFEVLEQ